MIAISYFTFSTYAQDLGVAGANSRQDWHHQLYHHDVTAVHGMEEKGLGYLDRKWVLQGTPAAGPLKFEFETKEENYLIICVGLGMNDAICDNTVWTIDGEVSPCGTEQSAYDNGKFYPLMTFVTPGGHFKK